VGHGRDLAEALLFLVPAALVLAGLLWCVRYVLRTLLRDRAFRARGVRATGVCEGYVRLATSGVCLTVGYRDAAGVPHTFTSDPRLGMEVPERGSPVELVYLPERPDRAHLWPLRTGVDNFAWGCLALPFLTALALAAGTVVVVALRGMFEA
jgi:hypothetical protein